VCARVDKRKFAASRQLLLLFCPFTSILISRFQTTTPFLPAAAVPTSMQSKCFSSCINAVYQVLVRPPHDTRNSGIILSHRTPIHLSRALTSHLPPPSSQLEPQHTTARLLSRIASRSSSSSSSSRASGERRNAGDRDTFVRWRASGHDWSSKTHAVGQASRQPAPPQDFFVVLPLHCSHTQNT
jgi:hypothetical protein